MLIPAASALIGSNASNQPQLLEERIQEAIMRAAWEGAKGVTVMIPEPANTWVVHLRGLGYNANPVDLDELSQMRKVKISWW